MDCTPAFTPAPLSAAPAIAQSQSLSSLPASRRTQTHQYGPYHRRVNTRCALYSADDTGMDPMRRHQHNGDSGSGANPARDENDVAAAAQGEYYGAVDEHDARYRNNAEPPPAEVDVFCVERTEGGRSPDIEACRAIWAEPGREMYSGETWVLARVDGIAVGAGRMVNEVPNVKIDKVVVGEEGRGLGVGKKLVSRLMVYGNPAQGAIYTEATRSETRFYSVLGFEKQGSQKFDEENHYWVNTMVYQFPASDTPRGCTGLHHISLVVADIERSLAFYGCIGFVLIEKFIGADGHRGCYVEGMGTRIEFVENKSSINPNERRNYGPSMCGFDRVVFDVTKATTDLETYLKHLSKRSGGWLEQESPVAQEAVGRHVISTAGIEDPDGTKIEFLRRETIVPNQFVAQVEW